MRESRDSQSSEIATKSDTTAQGRCRAQRLIAPPSLGDPREGGAMSRWARHLPWAVVSLFVAISLLWLSRDSRIPREAFVDYSVYNTSPAGLSLAYNYLASSRKV